MILASNNNKFGLLDRNFFRGVNEFPEVLIFLFFVTHAQLTAHPSSLNERSLYRHVKQFMSTQIIRNDHTSWEKINVLIISFILILKQNFGFCYLASVYLKLSQHRREGNEIFNIFR